jgi:hypothetical protein
MHRRHHHPQLPPKAPTTSPSALKLNAEAPPPLRFLQEAFSECRGDRLTALPKRVAPLPSLDRDVELAVANAIFGPAALGTVVEAIVAHHKKVAVPKKDPTASVQRVIEQFAHRPHAGDDHPAFVVLTLDRSAELSLARQPLALLPKNGDVDVMMPVSDPADVKAALAKGKVLCFLVGGPTQHASVRLVRLGFAKNACASVQLRPVAAPVQADAPLVTKRRGCAEENARECHLALKRLRLTDGDVALTLQPFAQPAATHARDREVTVCRIRQLNRAALRELQARLRGP